MIKFRDFECPYSNAVGICDEATQGTGLTFPDAYFHADTMVKLALAVKEHEGAAFCMVPFCYTLEGEALGGNVNFGSGNVAPHGGAYAFDDIHQLLDLPDIDFSAGRMHETLLACKALADAGEHVLFVASGPFTVLNVLIDARHVFKAFRKEPEVVGRIYEHLLSQSFELMTQAKAHGAEFLSFGDSAGGVNLIGPKLMEQLTRDYSYTFVKRASALADESTMVLLCPKTSYALVQMGYAEFVEHPLSGPMRYGEACIEMLGKVPVGGQLCVKSIDHVLKNAKFKEVRLM